MNISVNILKVRTYLRVEKRMLVMLHVMVTREELGPGCDW